MTSPFQCGGTKYTFPVTPRNMVLIIRVENVTGAIVYAKKNGDPSVGQDYILYPKDTVEIPGDGFSAVSIINTGTGDPLIFYSTENK